MTENSRQECQHSAIHTTAGAGSAAAEPAEPWDPWALALVMPLLAWAAARQSSEETILCTHKPCGGGKRSHHLLLWKGEGRPLKHIEF